VCTEAHRSGRRVESTLEPAGVDEAGSYLLTTGCGASIASVPRRLLVSMIQRVRGREDLGAGGGPFRPIGRACV
jgi:hypothetical protein